MEARYARELDTLVSCQRYLDAHADIAGDINTSGSRRALDAAIRDVQAFAVDQASGKQQRGAKAAGLAAAKKKLRGAMRPVAEVAKSYFRDIPEFQALTMPRGSIKTTTLVAAAGAMVSAASPYARTLIGEGVAPTFVDDIRARSATVTEFATSRDEAATIRSGATAGVGDATKRGRRAVAVIDALLQPTLEDYPALLAEWKSAKRISAKKGPAATALKNWPPATPPITPSTPAPPPPPSAP